MKSRRPILLLFAPLAALVAGVAIGAVLIALAMVQTPEPKTLIQAVAEDRVEMAVRLILRGQRPDESIVLDRDLLRWRKGDTTTPFLVGVALGRDNFVRFMLLNGVRLGVEPNDQALCVAARYGHAAAARVLIAGGAPYASCEAPNGNGKQPGQVASRFGYKSLAKLLRSYGLQREAETSSESAMRCDQATLSAKSTCFD
jgi:ankyrin repeat protein